MIIPIGHEQNTVRRQPWVTYAIMALCVIVFVPTHFVMRSRVSQGIRLLEEAAAFFEEHPYLELDPRLEGVLWGGATEEASAVVAAWKRKAREARPHDLDLVALEQVELDGLTGAAFDVLADTPQRHWGLVPAEFSVVSLVTHMFLHGGWLHLIGNLLFLYLTGPFVEDVWGRRFFAGFYLTAGAVAALFYTFRYPDLDVSLIGASGAIAGVMGAFAVRHWNRRIRFFYWFGVVFRGTFHSPAWVILPLWFLRELLAAHTMDVLVPGAGGGGIAYWAHVSGFAFGGLVGFGLRISGWEDRFMAPSLEDTLTVHQNVALDRALENRARGRDDEAWLLLAKEARRSPEDPDTVLTLWDLAVETGRTTEAAPFLLRLITAEVAGGEVMEAYAHWRQLRRHVPEVRVPVALESKLTEALRQENQREEASEVLQHALEGVSDDSPPGILVRLARVAEGKERTRLEALAMTHPDLPAQIRTELESSTGGEGREETGRRTNARTTAGTSQSGRNGIQLIAAVPLALREGKLSLRLGGEALRSVPLNRVQGVSAAKLSAADGDPRLILDLVLKATPDAADRVRVLRIETDRFDPRQLVPMESRIEDAFLSLAVSILSASGASWLLGANAANLLCYPSRREYERDFQKALRFGPTGA